MASLLNRPGDTTPRKLLRNVGRFLGRRSKPSIVVTGVALVVLLGGIDVLTGRELSFSVFYLLPVFFVTWFTGRAAGISISILSAITWLVADSVGQHTYAHQLILYWNMIVRLGFFLVTAYLVWELETRLDWERHSSRTDPLTQIANRRYLYDLAEMEIAKAARHGDHFTIACMDLDNFKLINDSLGHYVGDRLLSMLASTIRANLRASDVVARIGGDEFAILLPQTGKEAAHEILLRVSDVVSGLMRQNEWPVTASIGAVTFARPPESVDEMMKTADDLMYSVKRSGKGMFRHEVFR